MKDNAPKEQGIVAIAGVFGLIGGGVAYVAYNFGFAGAGLVALIVALIVAVALWLGWREPAARPADAKAPGSGATPAAPPGAGARDQSAGADQASPVAAAPDATRSKAATLTPDETARPGDSDPVAGFTGLRPSAHLAGQDELASRKGSWTYDSKAGASEAQARPDADAGPVAHPGATGASVADTANAQGAQADTADDSITAGDDTPDASDAASGPVDAGEKPQMMTAPRAGGADNLKEIKGVGPKLEGTLHDMGVYHFDQIAAWTAAEVAWMDSNLKGFKGRVSRDGWIGQAKVLAAGEDTEFSKRVDKGGVY